MPNKFRKDTLDGYEVSPQCHYDSFKNVWGICQWFHLDDETRGDSPAAMDTHDDHLVESWSGGHDWNPHIGETEKDDEDYGGPLDGITCRLS
jgi:hypothetical protein